MRLCKVIGRDPREVLDGFEALPHRWLIVSFNTAGVVTEAARELSFPEDVQVRLKATRDYVERPWWRRLASR